MAQRVVIPGFRKIETIGSGEGGITNYNDLTNKPSINNVPLAGNLNTVDLKLTDATLKKEGVPAEAKTVGDKLEAQSTSLTALSEQLGSHTVKSDVPENAVFTDTVYDDTEIQQRISDNGYGEVAGGKNLFNKNTVLIGYGLKAKTGDTGQNANFNCSDYIKVEPNTTYTRSESGSTTTIAYDSSKKYIYELGDSLTFNIPSNGAYVRFNITGDYLNNYSDIQVEEGETATEYEPYFPSNKMLAEENSQQSTEMMDIKMLGWSVPKECPIQNEANGNQFVQKVGRVDLGSLDWTYQTENTRFITSIPSDMKQTTGTRVANIMYLYGYKTISDGSDIGSIPDKSIYISNNMLVIHDSDYTDASAFKSAMQGKYLYYELATPITTTIDGNEIGETVSDVRKETTVNLLNPTLETTTRNGITCTNNGGGTYTFNGTATENTEFQIAKLPLEPGQYKYFGGSAYVRKTDNTWVQTIASGDIVTITEDNPILECIVYVNKGDIIDSAFSFMITTNLDATNDDFVPYTGDSGSLNGDVADLRDDVDGMDNRVSTQKINIHYGKGGGNDIAPVEGTSYIKTPPILVDGMPGTFEDVEESGGGGVRQFDYTYAPKGSVKFTVLDTLVNKNTTASGITVKPSTSIIHNGHYYRITGTATEDVTIPLYLVKNPSSDTLLFVSELSGEMSEGTFYYLISDTAGNTKQFETEKNKNTVFSGHSGEVKVSLVVKSGTKVSSIANVRAGYSKVYSVMDRSDKKYSDTADTVIDAIMEMKSK